MVCGTKTVWLCSIDDSWLNLKKIVVPHNKWKELAKTAARFALCFAENPNDLSPYHFCRFYSLSFLIFFGVLHGGGENSGNDTEQASSFWNLTTMVIFPVCAVFSKAKRSSTFIATLLWTIHVIHCDLVFKVETRRKVSVCDKPCDLTQLENN